MKRIGNLYNNICKIENIQNAYNEVLLQPSLYLFYVALHKMLYQNEHDGMGCFYPCTGSHKTTRHCLIHHRADGNYNEQLLCHTQDCAKTTARQHYPHHQIVPPNIWHCFSTAYEKR